MSDCLYRLGKGQRRGSKPRCHWITHGTPEEVASRLTALIETFGRVSANDCWLPRGFDDPTEAQLHEADKLLQPGHSLELRKWWFKRYIGGKQSSPSFDLTSTCTVIVEGAERRGLLLIEAKAHDTELRKEEGGKIIEPDASVGRQANHDHIGLALSGCNAPLNRLTGLEWKLSHRTRYQMSNRFGWAAKLMELGYPVVLVYLGFLRAEEMLDQGTPLADHAAWEALVKSHGNSVVPELAWDRIWQADGQCLVPLIRSVEISYDQPVDGFEVRGGKVELSAESNVRGSA